MIGEDTKVTNRIDINADIAESFGRWNLGEDNELVKLVTTVNVACGWHAGDPSTMHRSVEMAAAARVNIGAHPGFPDLLGFGRRPIVIDDTDAVDYVLYQVGALMGVASRFGVELSHVKPHGSFYGSIAASGARAVAIGEALQGLQRGIPMLLAPGPGTDALRAAGLPVIADNAADLDFDEDGRKTVSGREIPMSVQTVCVHGDRPNAVAVATEIRRLLADNDVAVRSVFEDDE
jgi:UPF0271 protein